jgi:hypothetical protein
MAYSSVSYTSTGGQTYNVPFPYLEAAHVKVYINGVETSAFTWSDAATIHLNVAPAVGATILIKRETPRDGMDKDFSAQPRLKGEDLDEALLQTYYIGLEALDNASHDVLQAYVDGAAAAQVAAELAETNAEAARDLAIGAKDAAILAQGAAEDAQDAAEAAADLAATYVGSAGAGTYMEVPSAPATDANEVKLYAKDVTGVAELFIRKESNGAEIQVTSGGILNGTPPDASEGTKGIAELATQTETDAGTDDARIVTPKKLYTTPGVYRKNLIINGDMMVWQRGTSGFTAEGFTADRWGWIQGSDATVSFSRSTDVPSDAQGGGRFSASLKMDVTGADTSIGAAQFLAIRTKLEGYDIRTLVGQNATLSFWVKAVKPGTYCVVFLSGGTDRMYPVEYTINSANTWEKKTITVPMTDCANGTWDFTNGVGLQIRWVIAAGSTYNNGTNETWGTTGLYGTPNQVNGLDSTNNDFYLTGVQLEKGSVATPFEHRPYAEELALCQRYYEKSYLHSVVPGTVTPTGRIFWTSTIANDYLTHTFKTRKRADAPSMTIHSPTSGASPYVYDYSVSQSIGINGVTGTETGFEMTLTVAADHLLGFHYTASSEL